MTRHVTLRPPRKAPIRPRTLLASAAHARAKAVRSARPPRARAP